MVIGPTPPGTGVTRRDLTRRLRAAALGRYPSSVAAASTRLRASSDSQVPSWPLRMRDAAVVDSPAR